MVVGHRSMPSTYLSRNLSSPDADALGAADDWSLPVCVLTASRSVDCTEACERGDDLHGAAPHSSQCAYLTALDGLRHHARVGA